VFIVGSEAGSLLKANMLPISYENKAKALFDIRNIQLSQRHFCIADSKIKWKPTAIHLMSNIIQKNVPEMKSFIEEYCRNRGIKEVTSEVVFQSKPDARKLYPNPVNSAYDPHTGPVYSAEFSPFQRGIFLTSSLDGSIRLYNILQVFVERGYSNSIDEGQVDIGASNGICIQSRMVLC
jgi:WD40 repeat protein